MPDEVIAAGVALLVGIAGFVLALRRLLRLPKNPIYSSPEIQQWMRPAAIFFAIFFVGILVIFVGVALVAD